MQPDPSPSVSDLSMGDVPARSQAARAPLWAVNALTFLASIGTGVVWAGIAFIAKYDYHYSETQTLALYLVLGVTYVIGALMTGTALRMVARWLSPRGALTGILVLAALASAGLLIERDVWMLWVVAITINILSSWLWPIVESYLTAGRHGEEMRRAMGKWNLVWTSAVAVSLIAMAPLVERHARMMLVIVGALYVIALALVPQFPQRPAAPDDAEAHAAIGAEYFLLLIAARMLLPLSYVISSAVNPLMPYLLDRLVVEPEWQTPITATWTVVRVATMALMLQWPFWHGRWGTLLVGGVAVTAGFALVATALSLWLVIAGLTLLGAGMGIIYFAALYYAMTVGKAAVDAGGKHEALIGVGYAAGPLAGFIGVGVSSMAADAGRPLAEGFGVVAVVSLLIAVGGIAVMQPYMRARRARRATNYPR